MIRIAALNDSSSDSGNTIFADGGLRSAVTKEAVENAAYQLYNSGLRHEREGQHEKAVTAFKELLDNEFITKVSDNQVRDDGSLSPNAVLKFSALKNLSNVYAQQGRHDDAIQALLKAIDIDFTDVSVCYRLGLLALKVDHYLLASRAFQKGLEISESHWPCLDNLLTLLYVLDNYESCLCYISEGLQKDPGYVKALVLRKVILKEQPCLEKEFAACFKDCAMDEVIQYTAELEAEEESEVLDVVRDMREKQKATCQPKPKPTINLDLTDISWAGLGKRLIELYKYIEDESPRLDHSCKLVMNIVTEQNKRGPDGTNNKESPMDIAGPQDETKQSNAEPMEVEIQHDSDDKSQEEHWVPALNFPNTDSDISQATPSMIASDSDHDLPPFNRGISVSNSAHSSSTCTRQAGLTETEDELELSPYRLSSYPSSPVMLTKTLVRPLDLSLSADTGIGDKEVLEVMDNLLDGVEGIDRVVRSTVTHMVGIIEEKTADPNDDDLVDWVDDVLHTGSEEMNPENIAKEVLNEVLESVVSKCYDDCLSVYVADILDDIVENVVKSQQRSATPVRRGSSDHIYAKQAVTPENQKSKNKSQGPLQAPNILMSRKRRSARVKQTVKKGDENAKSESKDHVSELEEIIPNFLMHEATPEHGYSKDFPATSNPGEAMQEKSKPDLSVKPGEYEHGFDDESGDVRKFLSKADNCEYFICVLREWVQAVCELRIYKWSPQLVQAYIGMYELYRPCFRLPNIFTDNDLEKDAMPAVLWLELRIDKEIKNGGRKKFEAALEQEFGYWEMVVGSRYKLPNVCDEFTTRFYNMGAQYYIVKSQPKETLGVYQNLLEYLKSLDEEREEPFSVLVKNCKEYSLISAKTVKDELSLLERTQSLEELQNVYDKEDFNKVIELLTSTFDIDIKKRYNDSRQTQLTLLVNTIDKNPKSANALQVLYQTLHECLHYFENKEQGNWQSIICRSLKVMSRVADMDTIRQVSSTTKVQLTQICVKILRANCKAIETEKKLPLPTVYPWIVLSVLTEMEQSTEDSGSKRDSFPLSIQVLLKAHSYLADYSLCTHSEGALLSHVITRTFSYSKSGGCHSLQDVDQVIQQSIYCLYGHPNKKIKQKNLKDHGAATLPINLQAAVMLFDYFKPRSMPEFDSYKSSTISAELENLLKRLVVSLPESRQPDAHNVRVIDDFLNEDCQIDDLDLLKPVDTDVMCLEVYYLLADYYFKNKEPLKAIKHYKQDLYYTPGRLDSWAGMALAKSSKLESRLGFMERQCYDGAFQKLAVSTIQCFARALQLNHDNVKLWIEYACSAYQLHSFASRVLKSKKAELSDTELDSFGKLRKDMLIKSKYCYMEASTCQTDEVFEEEWLHHYMLGKIAEKSGEEPDKYLYHYKKSSECLDEEGAQYPSKISYMYTAPYLAVEALELYYRIHTSILKSLQRSGAEQYYQLYTEVIKTMMDCPFVRSEPESPQQPTMKKPKRASTAGDSSAERPQSKRKKSESESTTPASLTASLTASMITTRRQGKLRLDAEIVHEVIEDLLLSVQHIQPEKTEKSVAFAADSLPEVRVILNDIIDKASLIDEKQVQSDDNQEMEGEQNVAERTSSSEDEPIILISDVKSLSQSQAAEKSDKSAYVSAECDSEFVSAKSEQPLTSSSGDDIYLIEKSDEDAVVTKATTENMDVDGEHEEQAQACEPEANKPEADQPEANKPETNMPEANKPEATSTKESDDVLEKCSDKSQSVDWQASAERPYPSDNNEQASEAAFADVTGQSAEHSSGSTSSDKQEHMEKDKPMSKEELVEACISALKLCVKRFPLHYKSYYRLAKSFLHDKNLKDLDKVQDLLLGNGGKKKVDKYVTQGLFQDRKHNNFFNGVWRIPVEEIERAGSFGAHLYKTIYLLLQFLHEKRDYHLLYQLHTQLQRNPDQEKKFLKDADRLLLSSKAMEFAIHSLYKVIGADCADSTDDYKYAAYLHQSYKWYTYCNKNTVCVPNAQVLLIKAYKVYRRIVEPEAVIDGTIQIDEAKSFCQQKFSTRNKDKSKVSNEIKPSNTEASISLISVDSPSISLTPMNTATKTKDADTTKVRESESQQKKETILPPVRGSFQPLPDYNKTKSSRPVNSATKSLATKPTETCKTVKSVSAMESTSIANEEPSRVPNPLLPIAATSWLNKAKDGGAKALASMFQKNKTA